MPMGPRRRPRLRLLGAGAVAVAIGAQRGAAHAPQQLPLVAPGHGRQEAVEAHAVGHEVYLLQALQELKGQRPAAFRGRQQAVVAHNRGL